MIFRQPGRPWPPRTMLDSSGDSSRSDRRLVTIIRIAALMITVAIVLFLVVTYLFPQDPTFSVQ